MIQMTSLQELINKRAEKKLDADLKSMDKVLSDAPLLKPGRHLEGDDFWFEAPMLELTVNDKAIQISMDRLLGKESRLRTLLKEYWLPVYIQRETKAFIGEHEELLSRLNELTNKVEDLDAERSRELGY